MTLPTCERLPALLDAIALGEVEVDRIHLAVCEPCRAALEKSEEVARALRAVRAPAGFADRVARRLAEGARSPGSAHGSPAGRRTSGADRPRTPTPDPDPRRSSGSRSSDSHPSDSGRRRREQKRGILLRWLVAASVLAVATAGTLYAALVGFQPRERDRLRVIAPIVVEAPATAPAVSLEVLAPERLTVGDEVEVAIVLRRALDAASAPFDPSVTLAIAASPELEVLVSAPSTARLARGDERRASIVVRATKTGAANLSVVVTAAGEETRAASAIEVRPAGRPLSIGVSLSLAGAPRLEGRAANLRALLPAEALRLEGPRTLSLRVFPGVLAEAELGLREAVRVPHGCFEQTTAATYPSLMVLTLARESGDVSSIADTTALAESARKQATAGAERLRMFQMPDGGFSIHGRTSSVPWLTAYGLQELAHLARAGIDVERSRIDGAAARLLAFEDGTGALASVRDRGTWNEGEASDAAVHAFAAHALASAGVNDARAVRIADRVEAESGAAGRTVYELALAGKALLALGRTDAARALVPRITAAAIVKDDGVTWPVAPTLTRSRGSAAQVETTALAIQVLWGCGETDLAARGLTGLFALRRADGYGGTQPAVQALEAVRLAGGPRINAVGTLTSRIGGADAATIDLSGAAMKARLIEVPLQLAGTTADPIALAVERGVELTFEGTGTARVQIVASGQAPQDELVTGDTMIEGGQGRLSVAVVRPSPAPLGAQRWTIRVRNDAASTWVLSPMVVADLPAGFAPLGDGGLGALVDAGLLLAHEMHQRRLVLYLPDVAPATSIDLPLEVEARLPGRFSPGTVEAYAYYDRSATLALAPSSPVVVERASRLPSRARPAAAPRDPITIAAGPSAGEAPGPTSAPPPAETEGATEEWKCPICRKPIDDPRRTPFHDKNPASGENVFFDSGDCFLEYQTQKPRSRAPARKGRLIVALDEAHGPPALNLEAFPLGNSELDRLLTRLLAAGLPGVAESRLSRDACTVTFRLKPDLARFSDGSPITPEDVVHSWERARAEVAKHGRPSLVDAEQMELLDVVSTSIVDAGTIEVRLPAPRGDLNRRLAMYPFLIASRLAGVPARAEALVASGEFEVASASGQAIELQKRKGDVRIAVMPRNRMGSGSEDILVATEEAEGGPMVLYSALPLGPAEDRTRIASVIHHAAERVAERAALTLPEPEKSEKPGKPEKRREKPELALGILPQIEVVAACEAARVAARELSEALSVRTSVRFDPERVGADGPRPDGIVRVVVSAGASELSDGAVWLGVRRLPLQFRWAGDGTSLVDRYGYLLPPGEMLLGAKERASTKEGKATKAK